MQEVKGKEEHEARSKLDVEIKAVPHTDLNAMFDFEDTQIIYQALGQVPISLDTKLGKKVMDMRKKLVTMFEEAKKAQKAQQTQQQ